MGSKRWQLENGLGEQLRRVALPDRPFIDLFAGSGAVAMFAAEELSLEVTAVDLQAYAVALSGAVISRTRPLDAKRLTRSWISAAKSDLEGDPLVEATTAAMECSLTPRRIRALRRLTEDDERELCRSYGGYYFSPAQAAGIHYLFHRLPQRAPHRTLCLAALISAASRCSASPGHTAQPFKLTTGALPHIASIWGRDVFAEVERTLAILAPRHASRRGKSIQEDAIKHARSLEGGELVFVDPPYSSAQYSRFYHVLEAIAVGGYSEVHGAGRAPALELRERSGFSQITKASVLMEELLACLGERGCRVVATFPQYRASNGLAGEEIVALARRWFRVDVSATSSRFSTLGGNGLQRAARRQSQELVITMLP